VFVHEAGVEGADKGAAVLDVKFEAVSFAAESKCMEGAENEPVTERSSQAGKVHLDICDRGARRLIEKLGYGQEIGKKLVGYGLLQSPIIVMAVKDAASAWT